ncbi:glycosyltransferase family 2 protein [Patescibacteria group bacterium]
MKIAVIIPAKNEKERIVQVLKKVKEQVPESDIIVVDDGSDDQTVKTAGSVQGIIVLRHRINLGKGAALKTGCEAAIQRGAETIVLMDADGQHNPEDIPRFLESLSGEHDIIIGSRKIGKDMPLAMRFGNKFLSLVTSLLFKSYVTDTQSGYRAFRASVYPKIKWDSTGYAVETEMIINAAKHHLRTKEIDIQTVYHDSYKGTTILDGIRIFINMILWRIQ